MSFLFFLEEIKSTVYNSGSRGVHSVKKMKKYFKLLFKNSATVLKKILF